MLCSHGMILQGKTSSRQLGTLHRSMISISPSTHLALLSGDGGVPVDELCEDAAEGLDAEGERGDVEEEDVGDVTGQDASLDGSAHGDGLVGVHSLRKITTLIIH